MSVCVSQRILYYNMFPAFLTSASLVRPIIEPITIPPTSPKEIPKERSKFDKIATQNNKPNDNPKPPINFV